MAPHIFAVHLVHFFQVSSMTLFLTLATTHCSHLPSDSLSSDPSTTPISSKSREVEAQLTATLSEARKLGHGNPLLLSTLFSLATFYREQKLYTEAEALYRELLTMKEEISGPNHSDLASILEQLAILLRETDRPLEAEWLTLRAESIRAGNAYP